MGGAELLDWLAANDYPIAPVEEVITGATPNRPTPSIWPARQRSNTSRWGQGLGSAPPPHSPTASKSLILVSTSNAPRWQYIKICLLKLAVAHQLSSDNLYYVRLSTSFSLSCCIAMHFVDARTTDNLVVDVSGVGV